MLTQSDIEHTLKTLKPVLAQKFSVNKIGYFGSFAEQKQNENSDLDILVEFSQPIGWKFFSLEKFLEQHFGRKVDLVTKNALKKRLKNRILKQVKYI